MNLTPSWDLFIIVFFIVIIAYSFIIGRNNTLKVILGTYVSMVAADASGNIFGQYFSGSELFMKILKLAAVQNEDQALIFVKIVIFVIMVILFAVKGAFRVKTVDDRSAAIRMVLSIVYAVMSAGLIIASILIFVSGGSFVGQSSPAINVNLLWGLHDTQLIRMIINNSYFWFSVPALSFLIHSIYSRKKENS